MDKKELEALITIDEDFGKEALNNFQKNMSKDIEDIFKKHQEAFRNIVDPPKKEGFITKLLKILKR